MYFDNAVANSTGEITGHLTRMAIQASHVNGYSHPDKQPEDSYQVVGYGHVSNPAKDTGQIIGCASRLLSADHYCPLK